MPGKFELKTASDGQFMFNLKAANGEVILTSELYTRKESALNGIESVRKNGATAASFERKTSAKGDCFFVLKASNGQTIGKSGMYASEAGMEKGIASVMTNAADSTLADLTQKKA